jgi:hypothetical protein
VPRILAPVDGHPCGLPLWPDTGGPYATSYGRYRSARQLVPPPPAGRLPTPVTSRAPGQQQCRHLHRWD